MSKEKLTVEEVVEKLDAGKAYFLLGNKMSAAVVEEFGFNQWRSVFSAATMAKNKEVMSEAWEKLKQKARLFNELAFVYACENDDASAEKMLYHMEKLSTPTKWLEYYAANIFGISTIGTRLDVLNALAEKNILEAVPGN